MDKQKSGHENKTPEANKSKQHSHIGVMQLERGRKKRAPQIQERLKKRRTKEEDKQREEDRNRTTHQKKRDGNRRIT